MNAIKNFIKDEAGITAIEYALLGAAIAVVVATAATNISGGLSTVLARISGKLV